MRNLKTFSAALLMAFGTLTATAQTATEEAYNLGYKPQPYGFVQVQGGMNTTFTDVNNAKIIKPTGSIAVGYMFAPAIGARLHVNGYKAQGGFDAMAIHYPGETAWQQDNGWTLLDGNIKKYSYNYINTNLDLMLNIVNLFSKKNHHLVDFYLIGGLGLNYAWGNKEFENITSNYQVANDITNAWGPNQTPRHSLLSHNIRVGALLDFNICKNWSIGAEVDMNSLDDRFNSKYNNSDDWMLTAQLSVTYKFGHKKVARPVVVPEPVPEPKPEPVVEPKAEPATVVPAPVVEPINETVYYEIRETENASERNSILNKVAEWSKKNPTKTIEVSGYADKNTGNPRINKAYAQQRAQNVARDLTAKGVPSDRIKVSSYGDTVQPFSENDKNRCVIIVGKL